MQMKPAPVVLNINDSHCLMIHCCAQIHVCYALSQQVQKKKNKTPFSASYSRMKTACNKVYDRTEY